MPKTSAPRLPVENQRPRKQDGRRSRGARAAFESRGFDSAERVSTLSEREALVETQEAEVQRVGVLERTPPVTPCTVTAARVVCHTQEDNQVSSHLCIGSRSRLSASGHSVPTAGGRKVQDQRKEMESLLFSDPDETVTDLKPTSARSACFIPPDET
ncbi:hypothetical protein AAFF_G00154930 [Aldrovandia affinis]|uniref:Uncharacterized protein n=1 Tax=Aldrovandia affinis TaxID=143900 RepID=A0AAD7WWQ7_9TELE|nr:hypothetical protein AAFF_G00154930 [Aldrovandia affinis]